MGIESLIKVCLGIDVYVLSGSKMIFNCLLILSLQVNMLLRLIKGNKFVV